MDLILSEQGLVINEFVTGFYIKFIGGVWSNSNADDGTAKFTQLGNEWQIVAIRRNQNKGMNIRVLI